MTSQDLVDGLLRSSGAAKIMGLSLEQTIALLTVMREASGRTGREVGNALNSILSYIQRPKSIETLEDLGIQVFADAARTQFRNVMLIFQDIAARWDSLSADIQEGFVKAADDAGLYSEELANAIGLQEKWNDLQQRDISQATAGVYRRNYFIGMIERLSQAQEVLNNMTDAAGYSMRENERTMDTLQKKYTSLLAAAQELAVALGDAGLLDVLKGVTEVAKDAADGFADLDDSTKALVLTVIELLGALAGIKGVIGLFTSRNLIFGAESVMALISPWGKLAAIVTATAGALALLAYNSSKASAQTIDDALKSASARQNEIDQATNLIKKYEELESKAAQNNEVKAEMLDIQRQLAQIYPDYVDGLDAEGNKLVTNIPLLREMNALKQQELELERQKIMLDANTRLPQLQAEQKRLQEQIDRNKQRLASGDTYTLVGNIVAREVDISGQIRKETIDLVQKLAANQMEQQMIKSVIGATNTYYDPRTDTLSGKDRYKKAPSIPSGANSGYNAPRCSKCGAILDEDGKCPNCDKEKSSKTYKNEPLQDALNLLQHKKQMNEITTEEEIAGLKKIRDLFIQTGEERMDIEERIYSAEKSLMDERLQNSVNWINEKKALGELSAEQEIAAWNRVLTNQKNNIEAVKEATLNLYRLQKELREKEVEEHKDSLKDLQDEIKDAYDERIDAIEKAAEAQKKAQEEIIRGIEDEIEALERNEKTRDFEKKMADLQEQEAYWSVRTGEEARKRLAEIREEIAELEHDREVELDKQRLEDEKQAAEDKIDIIEQAAKEQKEKWQAAYREMEKAFEDHNLDIIAQAATYSKEAFQQWYDNYIVPMRKALEEGDIDGFGDIASNIGGSIGNLPSHDYGMTDEDYLTMMDNRDRWWELYNAGYRQSTNAEMQRLNKENDALRAKYGIPAGEYPKFHTGAETLSYGMAIFKPGELVFPPDLSKDLKTLIAVSSGITGKVVHGSNTTTTYDNRKEVKIDKLLNIEKNYMDDEIDGEILSRQLYRAVLSLT